MYKRLQEGVLVTNYVLTWPACAITSLPLCFAYSDRERVLFGFFCEDRTTERSRLVKKGMQILCQSR